MNSQVKSNRTKKAHWRHLTPVECP